MLYNICKCAIITRCCIDQQKSKLPWTKNEIQRQKVVLYQFFYRIVQLFRTVFRNGKGNSPISTHNTVNFIEFQLIIYRFQINSILSQDIAGTKMNQDFGCPVFGSIMGAYLSSLWKPTSPIYLIQSIILNSWFWRK